jgi:hypothetical protein
VRWPLPRWRLPRRGRRLLLQWRASRIPADAVWREARPTAGLSGVPPEQQERAIEAACRTIGAERVGEALSGVMLRSMGVMARAADGTATWLKIGRADDKNQLWAQQGERLAQSMADVPMPRILREFEWHADGISWHAFQFTLVPSPSIQGTPWISAPMPVLHDHWFSELKRALAAVSSVPLSRWLIHPGQVARMIAQRFGRKAPYDIDEWRTAHGDLNWSNLTAPELSLLDWEQWGAAPRGFDAALLLSLSIKEPDLYRRIEKTFTEDLDTPSGRVARLFTLARRLNRIEAGFHDPREHRPAEREAWRLLRL